jgi:hypothetical protein
VRIRLLIFFFVFLLCNIATAQTFNYSYTDPCNGKVYNLSIPYGQNQIAVTYYGQVNTFSANDFNNGAFDNWAAGVFNQYQNASPCGGIGTSVTISQTQSTALNVISIFGALSAISDMASSGTGNVTAAVGSVNNVGGSKGDSKSSGNKKENKNGGNSSGSTASGGSGSGSNGGSNNNENNKGSNGSSGSGEQTGGQTGGSSGSGEQTGGQTGGSGGSDEQTGGQTGGTTTSGSGSGGSGGTTTSGSGSGGGSGDGSTPNQTEGSSDKKSDAIGGTTNAVKSGSGSATSKNGGRPSILMSSDLVGFQFNEGELNRGSRINAGYSSVRYDGLRSHGVMIDYTSSIQGGNITGYYAWINRKAITLLSNTVTIGFTGSGSIYNSIAFGQMRTIKKFKAVYMLTASAGQIYKESYYGSAAIVGGNRDFKIGKRVDIKTMALFVYAPFVRYYDDALLKSPLVILPIVGVNLGVTKTFKLNFNFGGAYSIGDNVLNYTIMMGTRLAL